MRGVAERVDVKARRSAWFARGVRVGLAAYGVVHLLFAWLAIRLVFVPHSGQATGEGALAQLARGAVGRWSLGMMSIALLGLALWQVIAMGVGYRQLGGWWRHAMRAGAGARAVVYGYFAWAAGNLAVHGSSGRARTPESMSARILDAPGGPLILALVGLVVATIGAGLGVFGARRSFLPQLDESAQQGDRRIPIVVVGQVGYVVKGAAFVAIGALLVWAALTQDAQKSSGLDGSLYLLLGAAIGKVAVVVIGSGIGCFGLYLFARAHHLNTRAITS